jgi:hypothetical protein
MEDMEDRTIARLMRISPYESQPFCDMGRIHLQSNPPMILPEVRGPEREMQYWLANLNGREVSQRVDGPRLITREGLEKILPYGEMQKIADDLVSDDMRDRLKARMELFHAGFKIAWRMMVIPFPEGYIGQEWSLDIDPLGFQDRTVR